MHAILRDISMSALASNPCTSVFETGSADRENVNVELDLAPVTRLGNDGT